MASIGGFSYAQAARGIAPTSNAATPTASVATVDHGIKDLPANTLNKSVKKLEKDGPSAQRLSQNGSSKENTTKASRTSEGASEDRKVVDQKRHVSHEHISSSNASESAATGDTSVTEASLDAPLKQGATEAAEETKSADEDWEKVSVPSVAPEKVSKELTPAPVPTVNFWEQRKALAKQQQVQSTPKSGGSTVQSNKPKSAATEDVSKRNNIGADNTGPQARQSNLSGRVNSLPSNSRDQSNSIVPPRTSSQQEIKPTVSQAPPGDTRYWPTPDTSNVEIGRRSSGAERTEKSDAADAKSSRNQTKWTQLNVTPTYVFDTPLPGSARRGGRGGARGRGAATTSAHRNVDKPESGSMAPPPLPKTTSEQDRGRKPHGERVDRAVSVPTEKQVNSHVSVPRDEQFVSSETRTSAHGELTGSETPASMDKSRASSRDVNIGPERQQVDTDTDQNESRVTAVPESARQEGEHKVVKEAGEKSPTKESSKERTATSQKSDTWRADRRNEDQAKRGRGGYRGRGGHSGYNSSLTSPLPQNEFELGKQGSFADRSRQTSQTFGGSPYGSGRINSRSRSIPLQQMQYFQAPAGFSQNLPPIQTDMYGYHMQMPSGMPSAVMSAGTPYEMNGFGLVALVAQQLEYYFSVDNLCKDMFLRKNMDTQGFVLLRVIAEFRRIKSMLQDRSLSYEQLRNIAQQCRNTEYVVGEDNEDRLRSREHWKDFVLPVEQRVPQAQNDGSQVRQQYPRHSTGMMPDFQMTNNLRSAPPNVNGFHDAYTQPQNMQPSSSTITEPQSTEQWAANVQNEQFNEERRMSTTSPLSKVQSPSQDPRSALTNMTNGHRDSISSNATAKENTFPDEEVIRLKVVVKDPDYQGDDEEGARDESTSVRMSGLRGGASSPEQFERIRNLQFGHNSQSNKGQPTVYFTQGDSPPHYSRPGYIHEDYLTLREQALSQRAEGRFDGACIPLYPFLAEFLTVPHQFNVNMYEDFKTWAVEDQEKGNSNGKIYLVKFYDAMLSSKTAMTVRLATDIIDIARKEPAGDRPVWLKLRAAWRNGATNMKTRKRLTDLLSTEEQTELDRSAT